MRETVFKLTSFWIALLLVAALLSGCASLEDKRDNYIAHGKELFEKGDYKRARIQFKNALQIDPKSAEAYLWIGKTELKLNNFKGAFGNLSKTAELNPNLTEAHILLGQLLLLGRQFEDARAKLDMALKLEPESIEAMLLAASLAAAEKQPQEARGLLKKILTKDPSKIPAYLLLSAIEAKEYPQDAAATLEAGLKVNPKALDLYLAKAQLADSQNQYNQAEEALLKAIELDPKKITLQTLLAQHYARAGQWDKVEGTLRRKISLEPDTEDNVKELAVFLVKRGRHKDAEQTVKDFAAQNPDNLGPQLSLADFYFTLRQGGKGVKVLQEIINKDPHGPKGLEAKGKLAALRFAQGRIEECERLTREILKDNPKDMVGVRLQGQLGLVHKDGLKAVTNFRILTQDHPKDPQAWLLLARAHLASKEPEQAKEKARKALEIKPDFLEARAFLYGIFLEAKDYNGVIQVIKGYLNYNDKDVSNLNALGDAYALKKDYAQAEASYQKIITLEPKNPLGYFKLALLSREQKKPEQALKYLDQALNQKPDFILALQQKATIFLAQKQPEKALGEVQGALARSPNNPQIQQMLGELYLSQHLPKEAIVPLEKAFAGNPNPSTLRLLGTAYHRLPDPEQVTRQLEERIADPKVPVVSFLILSSFYEQRRHFEKAQTLYETMVQRDIFPTMARNNLAYLLTEHSPTPANLKNAEKLAMEALEDNPEEASFLDTMGWVLCKRGEFTRAKTVLEQAININANSPTIFYHLGWCAAKSGDPAKARESLEKALALKKEFPDQAEAQKLLGTLPPAGKP